MNFTVLVRNAETDEQFSNKDFSSLRFAMRSALRHAGIEEDLSTEVLIFELGIHVLTINPDKSVSAGTEKSRSDMTR